MEFNKVSSMQGFPQRRQPIRRDLIAETVTIDELAVKYPFALQFYKYPPTQDTVSLQQFEQFAVDRLKALRIVEKTKLKYIIKSKQYRDTLFAEMKRENLGAFYKKTPIDDKDTQLIDYQDRRVDHISHFILRLAYCKTEEMRRWFLRQETDLFVVRFFSESRDVIRRWLAYNELHFEMISTEDKGRLRDTLRTIRNCFLSENTEFFKVPFTDVLELVHKRRVYIEKGFAYIKLKDLSVIVSSQFRAHLSQALVFTVRELPNVDDDTRLKPLLNHMHVRYLGHDYSSPKTTGHAISRHELNGLSEKSFPLCMRQLHTALRQNHHLRHNGRLQYALFLKGIGMTLDEVLQFWREEFTKIMDLDKFEKQHAYNIRHNFGKEGKRVSYTPYSCMKIITSSHPSTGDHHGCPFRHTEAALLKQKLQTFKVSYSSVQEIMDMVSQGHYQLACGRYFEATQSTELRPAINHPNQYFEESYKLSHGGKEAAQKVSAKPMINQLPVATSVTTSQPSKSRPLQSEESSAFGSVPFPVDDDDDMNGIMANM